MGSFYLNGLSPESRRQLIARLLDVQSGKCFICAKMIDFDVQRNHIDIDHVEPLKAGGNDGPDNFAVTHDSCNRSKQASNLRVARILASFDEIADSLAVDNRSPNLGDILFRHGGSRHGLAVAVDGSGSCLKTAYSAIGENDIVETPIYKDEISGFRYTFLHLPIEYIHHDDHINPRAIGTNLKKLVEEFHKKLPQLHITRGWIDTTTENNATRVQVFDGQHKQPVEEVCSLSPAVQATWR